MSTTTTTITTTTDDNRIRLAASDAQARFLDLVAQVAEEKDPVILTQDGRDAVALVPIEDLEWLRELEDRLDVEEAMASLAETEELGTTPWESIEADLAR